MHTIVVGSGPVGVRFVEEYRAKNPHSKITLFGDETRHPYNRVQLSALLAGQVGIDDIQLSIPNESDQFSFIARSISSINPGVKRVIDDEGNQYNFDRLVLATGARAHVPNIEGLEQTGVYTFRNLKDAEYLYARTSRAQHIVIVGGGLLGIETAKALLKNNTQVTIVQQGPYLMNRQLDTAAAALLEKDLTDLGVTVITNTGVREITGGGRVTGVVLRDLQTIECDTVLFCSGIAPNMELARDAGIRVGRGIVVDNQMQTSIDSIYAIGECCEHQDQTYGIVNPGYEQASVLADVLNDGDSYYAGSLLSSSLKVIDTSVRSFGAVVNYVKTPFDRVVVHSKDGVYRKIITQKGKLTGVISVGEWSEINRVQEAFLQSRKISFYQRWLFKLTGRLWPTTQSEDVSQWPATAVVCQCSNVSQGVIVAAIQSECKSLQRIASETRAGAVCGSCKPLLTQLLESEGGESVEREKEWGWAPLLVASVSAFVIALTIFAVPGIAVGESVQQPAPLEFLWNDKFWKQVSGFSLLALTAIGLLMSLRKRLKSEKLGKFAYWRLFHVVLGVSCAVVLILHTGMHLGDNLNRLLIMNFLAVLFMGAAASSVVALSHRLQPANSQKIRSFWSWSHIIVTWPLPILLGMHILTVYYF
ncbi:MAG: FAD-dependent oxidoreductase [Acidiferrobacterales bacterium]|nr:FAD-dependent oxidoreductase [Acidiferrobacterales bacterium]